MSIVQLDPSVDPVDGLAVSVRAPGDPLPGATLAWERLGIGHRCETWLAWSPTLWCPVVVKLPRPHQLEHPRARRSLKREVAALGGAVHPGLPRLVEDGTDAETPYVLVEFVDGVPLDEEIDENGAFAPDDVAVVGAAVLSALLTMHARGLAHLDLKPENVTLASGKPILLDFGSARRLGAEQPSGTLIGSAGYAAPELEAGAPIDVRMDLYGLGVTLHELLTGEPTFDPDLPAADRPGAPSLPAGPVADIVRALLDPEPSRRPDSHHVLATLGGAARIGGREPWPVWADAHLGRSLPRG